MNVNTVFKVNMHNGSLQLRKELVSSMEISVLAIERATVLLKYLIKHFKLSLHIWARIQ